MILYLHGFLSSAQSTKAQQLKQWLTDEQRAVEWLCPDLPIEPEQALKAIADLIESCTGPVGLIGSSLGGFYATVMAEHYNIPAVVINPGVQVADLLAHRIGVHKAWHVNEYMELTQKHVEYLRHFDDMHIKVPDNILLAVEKGDETLDYRHAVEFYGNCHQLIFNGGDHGFSRFQECLAFFDGFLSMRAARSAG